MADPVEGVRDSSLKAQLQLIRERYGDVVRAADLQREVTGFRGQRGIYKPAGSEYALWIRQTLAGVYPDQEPTYHTDGSWTYRYSPEAKGGLTDLDLPTNRGLIRCKEDRVPVGVFRQKRDLAGAVSYEVLGLAFVEGFDGTHFVLRGEPIDWTEAPTVQDVVPTFRPFEIDAPASEEISRVLRDRRFGVVIRQIYHERCSLCSIGYRVRGRAVALDAAHIIPVDRRGVIGDVRNGLLLCKNHHALFDGWAWTIDEDLRIMVSRDKDFRDSAVANHILTWEGQRLPNLPERAEDLPASEAIQWRMTEFERLWST